MQKLYFFKKWAKTILFKISRESRIRFPFIFQDVAGKLWKIFLNEIFNFLSVLWMENYFICIYNESTTYMQNFSLFGFLFRIWRLSYKNCHYTPFDIFNYYIVQMSHLRFVFVNYRLKTLWGVNFMNFFVSTLPNTKYRYGCIVEILKLLNTENAKILLSWAQKIHKHICKYVVKYPL